MITTRFLKARQALGRSAAVLLLGFVWAAGCRAGDLAIATAVSPLSLPIYVAQAEGLFAAEGLDVQVSDCVGGDACLKRIFNASAQFATASELPVIFSAFERNDFAIIATFVTSQSDVKVIARRSAGIADASQLAGKRVGVIAGSSAHYFFDSFMLFHGLDPNDVKQVKLGMDDLVPALEKREVDAIVGYSRQGWSAMKSLGADGVAMPDPRLYTQTFNLIAGRDTLARRPADVVKLLRALDRAERLIADRPQRARDLLETRLKLDRAYVDQTFQSFRFRLSLDQSLVATMAGETRWALREGHVPAARRAPNPLTFIEFGPLKAVLPQ